MLFILNAHVQQFMLYLFYTLVWMISILAKPPPSAPRIKRQLKFLALIGVYQPSCEQANWRSGFSPGIFPLDGSFS